MRNALVALLSVAAAALAATPSAAAGATICSNCLEMGFYDDVVVPSGARCYLIGTQVNGDVRISERRESHELPLRVRIGGRERQPTRIHGDVEGHGVGFASLFQTWVDGDFEIEKADGADLFAGNASLYQSVVGGDARLEGNTGRQQIIFSEIGGDLEVTKTTGGIDLVLTRVDGTIRIRHNYAPSLGDFPGMYIDGMTTPASMEVVKNTGPGRKWVANNRVDEELRCSDNSLPFESSGNVAARVEGQCF